MTPQARASLRWRFMPCGLALGVALHGVCATARADPVEDAKVLFGQARSARSDGHCASAITIFRQAYAVYPAGLGSIRNIAECQEILGQFASARSSWLELADALHATSDPKYQGWAQDAEDAIHRLASKVAVLVVDIQSRGGPAPGNVHVTINSVALPAERLGTAVEQDPGRYVVALVQSDGVVVLEQRLDLAEGETRRVSLEQPAVIEPRPPPRLVSSTSSGARLRENGTQRTVAGAAIGLGAASVVGATISLALRQAAIVRLHSECTERGSVDVCPATQAVEQTATQGRAASTLFNVFAVTGLAGLAGGIVLMTTLPRPSATVGLAFAPSGIRAFGAF